MVKRYRTPKIKDNEIRVQYGKVPYDKEGVSYFWGKECEKADMLFLSYIMNIHKFDINSDNISRTFFDELESRGYDLKTLRFSINKRSICCGDDQ